MKRYRLRGLRADRRCARRHGGKRKISHVVEVQQLRSTERPPGRASPWFDLDVTVLCQENSAPPSSGDTLDFLD